LQRQKDFKFKVSLGYKAKPYVREKDREWERKGREGAGRKMKETERDGELVLCLQQWLRINFADVHGGKKNVLFHKLCSHA
jgi:hypothetical protein